MSIERCKWADSSESMTEYHDKFWGVPVYDSQKLFEMLILEGKSCGLSWRIIWDRREGIKVAFDNLDPYKISLYGNEKIDRLTQDPRIIRHRLKIESVVQNARAYLSFAEKSSTAFSDFIWSYTDGVPLKSDGKTFITKNSISDRLSKDLKKRGFKFVGSTIIYSFMQAVGMINDHELCCFARNRL